MVVELETLLLSQLNVLQLSWWLLLSAFFSGVLASLSPCIYPLLPITIASLAPRNSEQQNKKRRAAYYCLGFALVYAALGWLAALSGKMFGSVASDPWVQIGFANLLLYFAAILKGWLALPNLLSNVSLSSQKPFFMGAASGLVAAPCTSPILAGLLLFVAEQQQSGFGAALLFCFALGMSALLFILGVFSHLLNVLPKSGRWLTLPPTIFALLMLFMAQYYLIRAGQALFF